MGSSQGDARVPKGQSIKDEVKLKGGEAGELSLLGSVKKKTYTLISYLKL